MEKSRVQRVVPMGWSGLWAVLGLFSLALGFFLGRMALSGQGGAPPLVLGGGDTGGRKETQVAGGVLGGTGRSSPAQQAGSAVGAGKETDLRSAVLLRRYEDALGLLAGRPLDDRHLFLKGYLLYRMKRWAASAVLLAGLASRPIPSAPWANLYLAQDRLRLGDFDGAVEACRAAGRSGPWAEPCSLIVAAAFRKKGDWAGALKAYQSFLSGKPRTGRAEARYRLMEAQAKVGRSPGAMAVQLRFLEAGFPSSRWTDKAKRLARRLRLPRVELSCSMATLRARGLMRARRYRQAHRELAALARRCHRAARCKAAYYDARALVRMRRRRSALSAFQRAVSFCDRRPTVDLKAKALYQAGKTARRLGRYGLARAYFRRIEREHPHHSYADDAAYKIAETWAMEGRLRKAQHAYERLLQRYPGGDMAQEALWRLVRAAWARGDDAAIQNLAGRYQAVVSSEKGYHAACRIAYWVGRSLDRAGHRLQAVAAMDQVVHRCPLTYYAFLAWSRLSGWDRAKAQEATRKMLGGGSVSVTAGFGDRGFVSRPGFKRARFLASIWLGHQALRELEALGLKIPRGKPSKKLMASLDTRMRGRLWAAADLLDRAGLYHLSHWLPRHLLRDYERHMPVGYWRRKWEIAYPKAFVSLVTSRKDVPHALLFGLMREESAFNPSQVSHARAVGLTQVLVSTARRFAGKRRVTTSSLRDPVLNLEVGSRYLAYLLRYFHDRSALAVAAYNAGERRVRIWVRKNRRMDLDEFVENIPFWETRLYTKRVLGSAFVYSVLWDAKPRGVLHWTLPAAMGRRRTKNR